MFNEILEQNQDQIPRLRSDVMSRGIPKESIRNVFWEISGGIQ